MPYTATTKLRTPGALGRAAAIMLLMMVMCAMPVRAQATAVVGSWVRVSTDRVNTSPVVGTLLSITRDSIALQLPARTTTDRDTIAIPLNAVRGMDLRTESHRHPWKGLGYGALSGAALGGALAAVTYKPCGCFMEFSRGGTAALGAITGGVVGGVVGTIIGSFVVTDVWMPSNIKATARFEIMPRTNGLDARLAYSFH